MAEARTVKIGTQRVDIKSCKIDNKSPQKGRAWLWSRDSLMFSLNKYLRNA